MQQHQQQQQQLQQHQQLQQLQHQQPGPVSAPVSEVQSGPAMVYMPQPYQTRTDIVDRYKHAQSIRLGAIQIFIGALCIIFNSVCLGMSYYNGMGFVGHGYWCGILFIITGIFGQLAGKRKTKCQIIAFMVLCIISASFTIALLVVGIAGAATAYNYDCGSYGYYYDYSNYPYYKRPCYTSTYGVIVAMESLLAVCGFIEAVVAIWGSALCCGSGICCSSSAPMVVVPSAGYYPQSGQVIYMGQTQGGPYVYSPQPAFSYDQGATSPPSYVQSGWSMPSTNIGAPVLGQAPPAYMTNQGQPVWMMPAPATNQGLSSAPSADPTQDQRKGHIEC